MKIEKLDKLRYWQGEYRKGNLDDEIICGEAKALLDGSAEESMWSTFKWLAITIVAGLLIGLPFYL